MFPQPAPDGFYTGNSEPVNHIGLLRNYFSWTWGDAFFVVIDPYWHSENAVDNVFNGEKMRRDYWTVTLGQKQYQWFKQVLEESGAKFKFVFAHHVSGTGRGGVEMADLYEWGGRNRKGELEFNQKRPGWEMPIHQLTAKNNVTIFFQGHDHIFAKQEKDGVIYQTLPYPADPTRGLYNEQAYQSGTILPGPGRLRVRVSEKEVAVEYVGTAGLPDSSKKNYESLILHSYTISKQQGEHMHRYRFLPIGTVGLCILCSSILYARDHEYRFPAWRGKKMITFLFFYCVISTGFSDNGPFVLKSPVVEDGGALPAEFTSYSFGPFTINLHVMECFREGYPIRLSPREFQLLLYFFEHRGIALPLETILNEVWGSDLLNTARTIDTHAAWLRKKLGDTALMPKYIITIHGFGYKFIG